MSLEIIRSKSFTAEVKRLAKRYQSFIDDLQIFVNSLRENPMQGVEIAPHIRKIRMTIHSKGRGKSGGARVITCNALISEKDGKIGLLLIYDKADASNVKISVIKDIIKEIGL